MSCAALQQSSSILMHIFFFLSIDDLCRVASSCKAWNGVEEKESLWKRLDVSKYFPQLRLYGEIQWKACFKVKGQSFTPLSVFSKTQSVALYGLLKHPQIQESGGGSLITLPDNLTLNGLIGLMNSPVKGKRAPTYCYCDLLDEQYGNTVTKTRHVFVSRGSVNDISSIKAKLRCEEAEVHNVLAHLLLTYHCTPVDRIPECLYEGNYILCNKSIKKIIPLIGAWVGKSVTIADRLCIKTQIGRFAVQMVL